MRNIQLWRLRDDDFQAIVAIPKQLVVAKEEPRAKNRSDGAKFGKDRLHRGAKYRAGQGLEIYPKAAPSVLLPPFPNWITLHGHLPLAAEVAATGYADRPIAAALFNRHVAPQPANKRASASVALKAG